MKWLAQVMKGGNTPAPNLQNLQKADTGAFVGFVGTDPDPFQNSEGGDAALQETLNARLALFTERGLTMDEAKAMAERLQLRDGQMDERRVCLECLHLSGDVTARRCSQWRMLGYSDSRSCLDLVKILQRCAGFNPKVKATTHTGGTQCLNVDETGNRLDSHA